MSGFKALLAAYLAAHPNVLPPADADEDLSFERVGLVWRVSVRNGGTQGRLRSNEVKCLFVLGCDDCSETLAILSADRVAGLLNAARTPASAVE